MAIEVEPTDLANPASAKSPESQQWLQRVRNDVKAKIFGPSTVKTEPGSDAGFPDDPVRIGRYVVIKRIGAGGMGLIYAAYDDTLDRKVAVKLLRPEKVGAGSTGQARLMREAQAIARLSHPGVVSVYEVGAHEDQVFIAMEYVDGVTLKVWQATRSWREILRAYVNAGKGLAAAHAAGIVHRDFKADNVLVRKDGAVRVLDFGLARTEFEQPDNEVQALAGTSLSDASLPLTHTGTVMGTPAYMAPEQHMGAKTDARTDQFSFCVSLHEALYGYRPFAGDNLGELRENVLDGSVEPEPKYTEVPGAIRRALLQGLEAEPEERFKDLESLLVQLEPPEVNKRRWRWAAVGVGLVTAAAGATVWWDATEDAQMQSEGERLRAQFEKTRIVNAEAELRRLRQRSVSERWDDLVLSYAEQAVGDAPTAAIAALKHLTPGNARWIDGARTIAADASRRGPIYRERGDLGEMRSIAFDPAGTKLLAHGRDARVHVWEFGPDTVTTYAPPPEVTINAVAFGPDGAPRGAGEDGKVYRFGAAPDEEPVEVTADPLRVIATGGDRIAVGDAKGTVHLIARDGTIERSLRRHVGAVRCLAFHPQDASTLASGGDDLSVWVSFLDRHTNWTLEDLTPSDRVQWTDGGRLLLSVSPDGELRGWDEQGRKTKLRGYPDRAVDVSVDFAGTIALYHDAGSVAVSFDEAVPLHLDQRDGAVRSIAASADGRWVAAAKGKALHLWRTGPDAMGRRPIGEIPIETKDGAVAAVDHVGGGDLLTSSRDGRIRRWAADGSDALVAQVDLNVRAVELAADGRMLAIEDVAGALHVLDLSDPTGYTTLGRVREHKPGAFAWAPDATAVAKLSCAAEPTCLVATYPADGGVPRPLGDIGGDGHSVTFAPDGRYLVSEHDSGLWLWDLQTGDGRRIELGTTGHIGYAFVDGSSALRIPTAEAVDDPTRQALRVFQTPVASPRVHQLFLEESLAQLVSSDDRGALLMETDDRRALVWFLKEDRFALLPDGVLPSDLKVTRLRVSPDRAQVLLDLDGGRQALLIDLASGQRRTLPPLIDPVTWAGDDTVVDVIHLRRIRKWVDPAPEDPDAFLAWLGHVTAIQLKANDLR